MAETAEVLICGAGIAGISTAYQLAVVQGVKGVVLVDEGPPLSLTSDKSTECYRNWWPGPGNGMVALMNRSIDLLDGWAEATDNLIQLNRRGYVFATARQEQAQTYLELGQEISELGAGPLRVHAGEPGDPSYQPLAANGFRGQPTGADLLLDHKLIRQHFPYLTEETIAVLHARRCGWFDSQQLGQYLLEEARAHGVELHRGRVEDVGRVGGRVQHVEVEAPGGRLRYDVPNFVIAAGPKTKEVAGLLGVELPMYCELHSKVSIEEPVRAVPRDAPLLIWSDPQRLPWSEEERALLREDPDLSWLLEPFPAGVHTRPEGPGDSPHILMLWTYDVDPMEPVFPPPHDDELYPEITLRGLSTMIPGLKSYFERLPTPYVDGGYYAKTRENRPLVGPLPVEGAYVIGALSGYGLMASPAAGELAAAHITGAKLPSYAPWFHLERYQDPEYQRLLEDWSRSGQL